MPPTMGINKVIAVAPFRIPRTKGIRANPAAIAKGGKAFASKGKRVIIKIKIRAIKILGRFFGIFSIFKLWPSDHSHVAFFLAVSGAISGETAYHKSVGVAGPRRKRPSRRVGKFAAQTISGCV